MNNQKIYLWAPCFQQIQFAYRRNSNHNRIRSNHSQFLARACVCVFFGILYAENIIQIESNQRTATCLPCRRKSTFYGAYCKKMLLNVSDSSVCLALFAKFSYLSFSIRVVPCTALNGFQMAFVYIPNNLLKIYWSEKNRTIRQC